MGAPLDVDVDDKLLRARQERRLRRRAACAAVDGARRAVSTGLADKGRNLRRPSSIAGHTFRVRQEGPRALQRWDARSAASFRVERRSRGVPCGSGAGGEFPGDRTLVLATFVARIPDSLRERFQAYLRGGAGRVGQGRAGREHDFYNSCQSQYATPADLEPWRIKRPPPPPWTAALEHILSTWRSKHVVRSARLQSVAHLRAHARVSAQRDIASQEWAAAPFVAPRDAVHRHIIHPLIAV